MTFSVTVDNQDRDIYQTYYKSVTKAITQELNR